MTYSSVKGVIFFSGSSSSANVFLYFSQLAPVALGMMATQEERTDVEEIYEMEERLRRI